MLEFLSNTVSFALGLLETIRYFVISLSKKVLISTKIVLKTINWGPQKSLKRALSQKLMPAKSLVKLNSRKLIPAKSSVKPNSQNLILLIVRKKIREN